MSSWDCSWGCRMGHHTSVERRDKLVAPPMLPCTRGCATMQGARQADKVASAGWVDSLRLRFGFLWPWYRLRGTNEQSKALD
jgi:hypothetical protein